MGIANYLNLSELMNEMLKARHAVSVSDMATEAFLRMVILASEGERADKSDLENGFINLVDVYYRAGAIKPDPADEHESFLIRQYETGELANQGYGGVEGDQFIRIKWVALTRDLPVIVNLPS
jgi:hypothetical protein